MLRVMVTCPERVLFEGTAERVIVPGEQGTFEIQTLHRPVVSRLLNGMLVVDRRSYHIRRGIVQVLNDAVTAVVELPER